MVGLAPTPQKRQKNTGCSGGDNTHSHTHYTAAEREHIELPHAVMFSKKRNNSNTPNKETYPCWAHCAIYTRSALANSQILENVAAHITVLPRYVQFL